MLRDSKKSHIKCFKDEMTKEERMRESASILEKHPNTIPIIVEQLPTSKLMAFDKKKCFDDIFFFFWKK
jgi:hypothetical protein